MELIEMITKVLYPVLPNTDITVAFIFTGKFPWKAIDQDTITRWFGDLPRKWSEKIFEKV